jgi:hypothetical protein
MRVEYSARFCLWLSADASARRPYQSQWRRRSDALPSEGVIFWG